MLHFLCIPNSQKFVLCSVVSVQNADLDLVVTVVVKNKYTVEFAVSRNYQVSNVLHSLSQSLSRVLLHLNVEKLPTTTHKHAHKSIVVVCLSELTKLHGHPSSIKSRRELFAILSSIHVCMQQLIMYYGSETVDKSANRQLGDAVAYMPGGLDSPDGSTFQTEMKL